MQAIGGCEGLERGDQLLDAREPPRGVKARKAWIAGASATTRALVPYRPSNARTEIGRVISGSELKEAIRSGSCVNALALT